MESAIIYNCVQPFEKAWHIYHVWKKIQAKRIFACT